MSKDGLGLYAALSRAPFPKSYPGKVLLSAFLGTHVPLLALIAHLARDPRLEPRDKRRVLAVALVATLGGAAATLWALHALLAPVTLASKALRRYLERGERESLRCYYTVCGSVLSSTSHCATPSAPEARRLRRTNMMKRR